MNTRSVGSCETVCDTHTNVICWLDPPADGQAGAMAIGWSMSVGTWVGGGWAVGWVLIIIRMMSL